MAHTTAFVTTVVEHWLEREIAHWIHHEGSIRRHWGWMVVVASFTAVSFILCLLKLVHNSESINRTKSTRTNNILQHVLGFYNFAVCLKPLHYQGRDAINRKLPRPLSCIVQTGTYVRLPCTKSGRSCFRVRRAPIETLRSENSWGSAW